MRRSAAGLRRFVAGRAAKLFPVGTMIFPDSGQRYRMFWTGFVYGFAVCLAVGLTARFMHEWIQRSAFIASLSPAQREILWGFEAIKGDWRAFRDLSS
jgi:hypothetical protein